MAKRLLFLYLPATSYTTVSAFSHYYQLILKNFTIFFTIFSFLFIFERFCAFSFTIRFFVFWFIFYFYSYFYFVCVCVLHVHIYKACIFLIFSHFKHFTRLDFDLSTSIYPKINSFLSADQISLSLSLSLSLSVCI